MNQVEDKTATLARKPSIGVREMIAGAVATVATGVQAWFAIGRRMGSNFEELSQRPGTAAAKIQQDLLEKLAQLDTAAPHGKELAAKMGVIYRAHENSVNKYWVDRNIHGPFAKLTSLKPHQRLEVLFGAIAVFSVSLGAIIGLAKSQELANLFRKRDHNDQQNQAQQ